MFKRPIVGTILCFVALRVVVAVETTSAPARTTVAVPTTATAVAATLTKAGSCSTPPRSVDLAICCNLPTPFPEDALSLCQKDHVAWINDENNSTCASKCLLNHFVKNIMDNPPEAWLLLIQHPTTYYNVISKCAKNANFEQLLPKLMDEGAAFEDALCEVDLLAVAECFSTNLFLKCPTFNNNAQCQSVKDFLNKPCLYSELFV